MLSSVLQMSRAAYHAYKSSPHGAHSEFSATLMRQSCEAPPQSAFEPGANRGVAAGEKRDGSSTNTHIKLHARGLWARARNGITFLAPRLVRPISAGFVDRRADIKTAHFSFRTTHIKSCACTLTFEDRQTQSAALCECWLSSSREIFTMSSRCGMSAYTDSRKPPSICISLTECEWDLNPAPIHETWRRRSDELRAAHNSFIKKRALSRI